MKKMLAILMILGLVCSSSGLALSATAQQAAPAPAPAAQPAPKAAPQKMEAGYRGNPESKIYHNSSCRYYKGKSVSKTFASPADAKAAGYRPCKVCKG
ncbi:sunset domain-containing protein [Desulfovibrio piger]|uniref:sunset domain-containing protein n=1 Tax=Desulfovibrio piger TaxID=901 RepID=UPI0026EDDD39|nr:Ada metal-binding domain-containing protein [Desulfovibrio piger]